MRYRAASELREAGFWVGRKDVWKEVRNDWRKVFSRETWKGERAVRRAGSGALPIPTLGPFIPAFRRLGIEEIDVSECPELQNVNALKNLPTLKRLRLIHCTALKNVDGLEDLTALRDLNLSSCTGLENVRALHFLFGLERLNLSGCYRLSPRSVTALIVPLENATIIAP